MGQTVEFASNGNSCPAYLAIPASTGPGVVVIQEYWGLVDHIKDVCDRLASEGFVALAPDLFRGKTTTEPDEATKSMMAMNLERAGRDMAGAVDYLRDHPIVDPKTVAAVGFCMGGTLALTLGAIAPVQAVVAYYPYPFTGVDLSAIKGAVLGHIGEQDQAPDPKAAENMFSHLRSVGVEAEYHVYPGTDHAFFNDARPESHDPDAAALSWERTISFLRTHLSRRHAVTTKR